MTLRGKSILNLIVADYIGTAAPVASESIARNHELGVSSATIRNDIADLEQEGFVTRPHPSAGSVPLDKGYRVYVETVASPKVDRIPLGLKSSIRQELIDAEADIDGWTSAAATVLAQLAGNMAIATFPKARESRVKNIQLVELQDFLALLIVVFQQARLRKHLVRLRNPADPNALQRSANKLSELLGGKSWNEIESNEMTLSPLEKELVSTTVVMLKDEDQDEYRDLNLDGLRNLFRQPEFADKETLRSVVEAVEDGSLAQAILDEAPEAVTVRVAIGRENRGDALQPLSVVIGRYGVAGEAAGAVGAVGPVRMEYSKTIGAVEFMAEVMTELVENVRGV